MTNNRYEVWTWATGADGTCERYPTKRAACRAVVEHVNRQLAERALPRGSFMKRGDGHRVGRVALLHKSGIPELGAYLVRI